VVEGDVIPIRGAMTCRAIRAKATIVMIVLLMTGETIRRCTLEDIVNVALVAFDAGVLAFEFESRKVVVKPGGFPTLWCMTPASIRTKRALMSVIPDVAGLTV